MNQKLYETQAIYSPEQSKDRNSSSTETSEDSF